MHHLEEPRYCLHQQMIAITALSYLCSQIGFLQSIIRPFMYIGTDAEFYQAKQSNQVKVTSQKSICEGG